MPKFDELVSKVTVEGNANDTIAKDILSWLKDSKPVVIVKGDKNKTISKKRERVRGNSK